MISSARGHEAAAAELALLDEPDEEGVELRVVAIPVVAEPLDEIATKSSNHGEPRPDDGPPFVGEILDLHVGEARAAQQRAIAVEGLGRRRGHPLSQPMALEVAEPRPRDPVREGQASARAEDT